MTATTFRNAAFAWWNDPLNARVSDDRIFLLIDHIKSIGYSGVTFSYGIPVDLGSGAAAEPSISRLWRFVDYAKTIGLDVQLKTHITDSQNSNLNLWSNYPKSFSFDNLLQTLINPISNVAKIAQEHQISVFYIGTENNSFDTVKYYDQWKVIIDQVKKVYSGLISYDALYLDWLNKYGTSGGPHKNDYGVTALWDLVDAVSVSFYPQLQSKPTSDVNTIIDKYFYRDEFTNYSIVNDIINLGRATNKPIFLGEAGFIGTDLALNGSGSEVDMVKNGIPQNYPLQALAFQALFEMIGNNLSKYVKGINLWEYNAWTFSDWIQNPGDSSSRLFHDAYITKSWNLYSNKLAEEIISKYVQRDWTYHTNLTVNGSPRDDILYVSTGNNLIQSGKGSDEIHGGLGIDTSSYPSLALSYSLLLNANNATVKSKSGDDVDTLFGIERITFLDKSIALDLSTNAGQAYRVYKAAFNRDPMQGDTKGLGYWIAQIDKGMNLTEVAARFVDSNEFRTLYGTNPTNEQFLTKLYTNVLGRQPEASGFNWWLNELNTNPTKTRAKVLADFAESAENQAGVLGLIGNGITYEPWVG